MKSKLHIKIKGSYLWKICAVIVIIVVMTCCSTDILSVDQPSTATVGQTIPITMKVLYTNTDVTANMVVAVLLPVGWNGAKNLTMTYTSPIGNGTFNVMPSTTTEPASGGLYNWPTALMNKFGIVNNYIKDMEWVVFVSDKAYTNPTTTVTVNMKLTVGADGGNANVALAYVVAETNDGLKANDGNIEKSPPDTYEFYELYSTPCLDVSGSASGSIEDFCDAPLTTIDPFKALTDDFVTVNFDATILKNNLLGATNVYLKAIAQDVSGNTYNGPVVPAKSLMAQVSTNKYQITIWPRAYFGVPKTQTLSTMKYVITDVTGNTVVGANATTEPITYGFTCK
ncbi:protein of unknown function [Mucilaginibacter mallensis]|uniref:DUF4961 domain-containing protein n=1 Tax=Mucilaginibacter mallensis TaxID=652787 RepID=A0A1H1PUQ8_MUCMA|nr:DUF4961 domain-containing protein [Mucilaginibacter mallensis]SDS14757.1 protein of unknown function [Mucilaginibacter mallensis]